MKTKKAKVLTILAALLFALSINAHARGAVDMLTGASAARNLAKQAADSVKKAEEYKQKASEIEGKAAALSDKNRAVFLQEMARLGVRQEGWLFADAQGIFSGDYASIAASTATTRSTDKPAPASSGSAGKGDPTRWTAVPVDTSIWGYTWKERTYTGYIKAIAYGNNRFVAGGQSGEMAYSSDGRTWTVVADKPFYNSAAILAIAYANNRFVAGDEHGNFAYSADGINWTRADSFIHLDDTSAIAWGNNRFVAVGVYGRIAYSTDNSVTWTDVSDSPLDDDIFAIAFGNNRFVAGGYDGIAYSSDGVIWTAVAGTKRTTIRAIAYGNNRFVADVEDGIIVYSDDGVTWTSDSRLGTKIYDFAYGNNRWVAVGVYGRIAYSTDNGVTWTEVEDSPFGSTSIHAIAYGNGRFVAVGYDGKIAYSD